MARVLAWLMAGLAVAAAGAAGVRAEDQPLRFLRFLADGEPHYGYLIDDTIVELEGDFLHTREETGRFVPLEAVELLPPVVPSKVIGVALNYPLDGAAPPAGPPGLFAKLPSSVVAHGAAIVAPPDSTDLHFEGEVVVVIGSRARNISPDQAAEVIFGVTAGNDVTERGYEPSPFNVLRIKAADTFAPLGPWVVPGLDYNALRIRTRLNGEVVQDGTTARLIHSIDELVSFVSRYVTLEPGDVIYTGTPGPTRAMQPGDVVEVEVEGVGTLRNTVEAAP